MDALAETDVSIALTWAAFSMTLIGIIFGLMQGMSFEEVEKTLLAGFRTMLPALLIMILAWSIGAVNDALGTAKFVVNNTENRMNCWHNFAILYL